MKTIIGLLTTTVLVAGASYAMAADRQASDEAAGYALSQQGSGFGGAYDSARPGEIRNSTFAAPHPYDVQAGGNN
jgi:hypothetical protein